MYKVWMIFDCGEFVYGTYADSNTANEIAMYVRDSRHCDVWVEKI